MTESLATLLDHSMISPAARPDGERAFRLLDVSRHFAYGRLENPDEMLAIARSLAYDNQRAEAHYDLAMDALSAGDLERAHSHLSVAARHDQDIDHRDGLARRGVHREVAEGRAQTTHAALDRALPALGGAVPADTW